MSPNSSAAPAPISMIATPDVACGTKTSPLTQRRAEGTQRVGQGRQLRGNALNTMGGVIALFHGQQAAAILAVDVARAGVVGADHVGVAAR